MSVTHPITAPARGIAATALAFGARDTEALFISRENPLPVATTPAEQPATALSGTTATSSVVGPFTPGLGLPMQLSLSGSWTGVVQLKRSVDGGVTQLPLTLGGEIWARFIGNANECAAVEYETGASYYLDITLSSGTLTYRIAQ